MRTNRTIAAVLAFLLATGCAAKIPPASTFNPTEWAKVEALAPGSPVEVRCVTGNPPLRYTFRGTLESASRDWLVLQTSEGPQRLMPQRVVRVTRGFSQNRAVPLAITLGAVGAALGGMLHAMSESDETLTAPITLGLAGATLGGLFGQSTEPAPQVVYAR